MYGCRPMREVRDNRIGRCFVGVRYHNGGPCWRTASDPHYKPHMPVAIRWFTNLSTSL